jgi:type II secretory pathway pseudopilin PulG
VVIAIISLLVSILLPTLQSAKELAKIGACSSNQRSIVLALTMYAHDYDGRYPFLNAGTRSNTVYRGGWMTCYRVHYYHGRQIIDRGYAPPRMFDCPGREKYPNGDPARSGPYTASFFDMSRYTERLANWLMSGYEFRIYRLAEIETHALLNDSTPFSSRFGEWPPGLATIMDRVWSHNAGIFNHPGGTVIGYADSSVMFDKRWNENSPREQAVLAPGVIAATYSSAFREMCTYMDRGDEH